MADRFRGWQVVDDAGKPRLDWRTDLALEDLADGDVVIDVSHASFNYKDGLALTGKAPIIRRFPCVPGIDLAGTVLESQGRGLARGDVVLVTGFGLGETHDGGFAERARVRREWVMKVPPPFTAVQAMAIGTAGFTAMLAVQALEQQGVERPAEVLVTGAGGGVGSMAVALLAAAGFAPVAVTGRAELEPYLRELGAVRVLPRSAVASSGKGPLDKAQWAAAIDTVGGPFLADLLKAMRYEGTVAACGLVGGADLPTTVYPFILRGVRLIGIDSVQQPMFKRDAAWGRLAVLLDADRLGRMTRTVALPDLPKTAEEILAGQVRGRVVVEVKA
ncbi:MAG: MDR family oxidoreductase [Pseudomonadota bacterium]